MMEELTAREKFEATFGAITDDQWRWLKEFCERNYVPKEPRVVGYRVEGRTYHPSEVGQFYEINGQFFPFEGVERIVRL